MSFINANTNFILVEYLEDTYPITLVQNRPFFDRITKKDMSGESAKVPYNLGYGGGVSNDFETALANAQASGAKRTAYSVDPNKEFGITYVENSEVPFTQGPESAIDILTDCTKGAMELAAQNFETTVFGSGFSDMSIITSFTGPVGTVYTLTLGGGLTDVIKFGLGMVLSSKLTPANAAIKAGSATVVELNQLGGTISVDAGASGWVPVNNDVIGLQGSLIAGTAINTFPGIFGWCPPITARTNGRLNDVFLGVTRANAGVATAGWALDGRGKPVLSGVNALAGMMANLKNSKPNLGICNPVTLTKICDDLDTKARYDIPSRTVADVFFEGVEVMTPAGKIEILAESSCPANQLVITKDSSWVLGTPKNKPFAPTDLEGKLMTPSYDHNRTRFSVTCAGFFYSTNIAATGVLTIS